MLRTFFVLLITLLALPVSAVSASIISNTFTFGGNSSVGYQDVSFSQSMSTGMNVYTKTVTDVVGSAVLTYDINVIAPSGNVYSQAGRGFGDDNSQGQFTDADGVFRFTISNVNGSLSANAAPGSSISLANVDVEFTSFDVVNNGAFAPSINWTDDGTTPSTSPMVTGGNIPGFVTQVFAVTQNTQDLRVDNVGAGWSWINNIQAQHQGVIIVDVVSPVPEPSSACVLGIVALTALLRRRR